MSKISSSAPNRYPTHSIQRGAETIDLIPHCFKINKVIMTVLRITSSPRKGHSKSRILGAAIIDKLLSVNPNTIVRYKDLNAFPPPHLDEMHLIAFHAPVEHRLSNHDEAIKYSDEAIKEIKEADILVVEAPLYNLTIASTLKAWIDHIVRANVTFIHTADGDIGLIKGKKNYVAVTAGYIYSEGAGKNKDFVTPLLREVFKIIGITDVTFIMADGLSVIGVKETALQKAIDSIKI